MIRDNVKLKPTTRLETSICNGAFSGFSLSVFGWALFQTWGVQVHAGAVLHGFIALPGLTLVAIAFRRYRLYWPPSSNQTTSEQPRSRLAFNLTDAGWCLILLAIGHVLGRLVLAGWILPLTIFAGGLTFVPWSKVRLCRSHFFASCTIMGIGTAYQVLVAGGGSAHPLHLPIAACFLSAIACFALLRRF
jgi:hypothetical protein